MAALTLTRNLNPLTLALAVRTACTLTAQAGAVACQGYQDSGWARPDAASGELARLACLCLLDEDACLQAGLEAAIAGLNREQLLQLARWARSGLGLSVLPLVLLAEASVRHSGNSREAKGEVRQAVARLVRNGAEATRLLAYWLQRLGGGKKAKLPNALKKGLSEALAAMSPEQLLAGPLALSLKDLLCLVHARPCDQAQAQLYARILAGQADVSVLQLDQPQPAADAALAGLPALRWLMLEREAEEPEQKQALRLVLADALPALPRWSGRSALLVDSGETMLARPDASPALQLLDIGAMLAALAALANDCLLAAFASEVRWLEACVFPVETALRLRQADTGWGSSAWKAVAGLVQTREPLARVLIFSTGEPDDALLANWQRYLGVCPVAVLYWVDLGAESKGLELAADGSRIIRIRGWSERLLELMPLLESL